MARFHPLEVTDLRKTTRDAVVVTLKPVDGGDFGFIPGQYLTFRKTLEDTELRRSYSICIGGDEQNLQVGIKRVDGGAFSTWANEALRIGDVLEAMPPQGNFNAPLKTGQARSYLAFAGGSGITPVLSILKTTLATEPESRFTLVYANRSVASIMFREELEDLKNIYLNRFRVIHFLEHDAQAVELFTGRLDTEKCDALFSGLVDVATTDMAFICRSRADDADDLGRPAGPRPCKGSDQVRTVQEWPARAADPKAQGGGQGRKPHRASGHN